MQARAHPSVHVCADLPQVLLLRPSDHLPPGVAHRTLCELTSEREHLSRGTSAPELHDCLRVVPEAGPSQKLGRRRQMIEELRDEEKSRCRDTEVEEDYDKIVV